MRTFEKKAMDKIDKEINLAQKEAEEFEVRDGVLFFKNVAIPREMETKILNEMDGKMDRRDRKKIEQRLVR